MVIFVSFINQLNVDTHELVDELRDFFPAGSVIFSIIISVKSSRMISLSKLKVIVEFLIWINEGLFIPKESFTIIYLSGLRSPSWECRKIKSNKDEYYQLLSLYRQILPHLPHPQNEKNCKLLDILCECFFQTFWAEFPEQNFG